MTYSVQVTDTSTCQADYEENVDVSGTVPSGTCYSYLVESGVACLSGCASGLDCYVSEIEQVIAGGSCAAALGIEVPKNDSALTGEGGTIEDGEDEDGKTTCYDFNYAHDPSYRMDPPEERECSSACVSYETVSAGITLSIGRCTSGIRDFCEEMQYGDISKCVECKEDLCNPVYYYNGSISLTGGLGLINLLLVSVTWAFLW